MSKHKRRKGNIIFGKFFETKKKPKPVPYDSDKLIHAKWAVFMPPEKPTSCILALPGRGQSGFSMAGLYAAMGLPNTIVVGVTPTKFEWYPMPNGVKDQAASVASLPWSVKTIDYLVKKIKDTYGVSIITIVGWSAGAVMAIQAGAELPEHNFAAIVSHAGAALDPDILKDATSDKTGFLLIHSRDDASFDWHERYLPTRWALQKKGYTVYVVEKNQGGHGIFMQDIRCAVNFIAPRMGYPQTLADSFLK